MSVYLPASTCPRNTRDRWDRMPLLALLLLLPPPFCNERSADRILGGI